MVRAFDHHKSSSFNLRKMLDSLPGRQSHSSIEPSSGGSSPKEMKVGSPFIPSNDKGPVSRLSKEGGAAPNKGPSDRDLMKERFAKLLLGEDMSGGGKGVSSGLALSNAITNLAASVFGEQKRLEPMSPERKARWRKEVDWLLSVTDHIVELVPSQQQSPDGTTMEVMVTRQRGDLLVNIPALRKLDAMLIDCLDNFKGQNEFKYVDSKGENASEKTGKQRENGKWWIPTVKIPPGGLTEATRKRLQCQKDSVNQVLNATLAINAQILTEMEIPESYIESLPKNGRASLGDAIYKSITDDSFDPEQFLATMDLSSEHKILDLKNRIEASIVIWQRKMNHKDGKSSWGLAVSAEKRELFEERAETILRILKHQFPGIAQSSLDITKIQYNKARTRTDVGHAVLESYSRVLESLASAVINRIDDVLYTDNIARNSSTESDGKQSQSEHEEKMNLEDPSSMTLMDFMGWNTDQGDDVKKSNSTGDLDQFLKGGNEKLMLTKTPYHIITSKKISYLERLEKLGGMRSPTARH
ncbi:Rho guanine nucleotide exchange factor 8-like protein [Drosera capensis]